MLGAPSHSTRSEDSIDNDSICACPANSSSEQETAGYSDNDRQRWFEAVSCLFSEHLGSSQQWMTSIGSDCDLPPPTVLSHVPQLSHWDCGIACLLMVFEWLSIRCVSHADLAGRVQTQSVWTVDLVIQLHQILNSCTNGWSTAPPTTPSRLLFCSQVLHVNEHLGDLDYYRAAFGDDRLRVQALFEQVRERHLPAIQMPYLPLDEIVTLVRHPDCVAIVLVDNSILRSSCLAGPSMGVNADSQVREAAPLYVGHYILVTGVVSAASLPPSSDEDRAILRAPYLFQVHNPALMEGPSLVDPTVLDRARRAPGTDHDIIFVVKRPNIG